MADRDELTLADELRRLAQRQLVLFQIGHPDASVQDACDHVSISRSTYYEWQQELLKIMRELMPQQEMAEKIRFVAMDALLPALGRVAQIAQGEIPARPADVIKATKLLMEAATVLTPGDDDSGDDAITFLDRLGKSGNVFVQQVNVYQQATADTGETIDGESRELISPCTSSSAD